MGKQKINRIAAASDTQACLEKLVYGATPMRTLFSQLLLLYGQWQSSRCSLSWKIRKTGNGKLYPKLLASSNTISILPTVVAIDGSRSGELVHGRRKLRKDGLRFSANLCDLAKSNLLPTPTTGANRNSKNAIQRIGPAHQKHGVAVGLAQAVELYLGLLPKEFKSWSQVPYMYRLLPTPTTREYKGGRHPNSLHKAGRTGTNSLNDAINGIAGRCCKLNPLFVTEMMGFPIHWTLAPFQKIKPKLRAYEN